MNKYWIPHLDIHKKVITQELQYYLGPEATVRSFTREVGDVLRLVCDGLGVDGPQGEDGFLITTPGPCLTDVSPQPVRGRASAPTPSLTPTRSK